MKKLFSVILLLSAISIVKAQYPNHIIGKVQNKGQLNTVDAATVNLLKAIDSSLIKTVVTDKQGNFSFENAPDGIYLISITSVGSEILYSNVLVVNTDHPIAETGTLILVPENKNLSAVTVSSHKQFVERKIDKTVINPEALISNTGTTAMEVLEKAPGISVDKDGNISLKGKQGVIVMLDGKPSYMSSVDLANYLRGLPSSAVDIIEIMTNPSAKYDASGNSGIINIKTKKNKQKGFNGSLSAAYGYGKYSKTNNSLNLNYKTGKVNIFSTLSANYRKNKNHLDINRIYSNDDETTKAIFDQNTITIRENKSYSAKLGMDFYATGKTTFGIVFTGYTSPGTETGSSVSYLKNPLSQVDSIVTADRMEKNKWKNTGINLNMRHSYDSAGKEISADIDYLRYKAGRNQNFLNGTYNPDFTSKYSDVLLGELPSDIKIYSAKVDYARPLKKGLKLETGLKFSYVQTDNAANYFNMVNDVKTVDYEKTNHFKYEENVNAAYINLNRTIKKWGLQFGLRAENTNYDGLQFDNPTKADSSFKKSYTSVFPTTYISYNANDKNQFGISVGRRINRPDYEDLNPFLFFIDKYTYEEGNPYLKPSYSNVVELSHTYRQFLTTTVNYSHTTDLFSETFRQSATADDSISTIVSQGNYGIVNNLSVSVNAQVKITKWFTSILYGEGRYQEFKGNLNGEDLNVKSGCFTFNVNNQFTFKKGWAAELSAFYRTRTTEGQVSAGILSQVDAAVKKDILKTKGSLRLSVRDIFGPMKFKGSTVFQNTDVHFFNYRDSRVVTLGFNYRFGKPIKGLKNRKSGGAGDEQNRVKSAG